MDTKRLNIQPRLTLALLLIAALGLCGLSACQRQEPVANHEQAGGELVFPAGAAYQGAYVDFGEGESHVSYDALTAFEGMVGKHLALVAFGNFWGDQAFPAKTVAIVSGYGAIPLLFWSPWDKPYAESKGPDRFALPTILAGQWDSYIDQWAESARQYGKPLMVAWGLEMNGVWFPWSGEFYGGGEVVGERDGQPLYKGPELVKKAYRYVVDRVRAKGATNILWGFHANHFSSPQEPWNAFANYYPGADYVDWLGLSVYGQMAHDQDWSTFVDVMEHGYQEICQLDGSKPVIVAEWGVGEFPPADKGQFLRQALNDMRGRYQRVRAAVYWHERWENEDGSFSNLHVNSSPAALRGYRTGLADPYWLDRPQFRPAR